MYLLINLLTVHTGNVSKIRIYFTSYARQSVYREARRGAVATLLTVQHGRRGQKGPVK